MHIALAFNLKGAPPVLPISDEPYSADDDLYAEWDDIHTIEAVKSALARKHQVSLVEADLDAFETLRQLKPDLVFNMSEGLLGASREAQVPAMLDMLGLAYTGSDPVTLGICLDKRRTKEILAYHGVATPRFVTVTSVDQIPSRLRYPQMVKPILEGSSKGVPDASLVHNRKALVRQVKKVLEQYRQPALIEDFLPGREFTVAVLGNGSGIRILPVVEINFDALPDGVNPIYSYEAKWVWDREEDPLQIFTCPALLDFKLQADIEDLCRRAFTVLGCRDWCRIDVRLDSRGAPHIIELNPLPGILPRPEQNSCFPKAARAAGLSYDELILAVVDAAAERLNLTGTHHESSCLFQSRTVAVG
ncbi:MAG: ATP-grasp domain-containing protein [Pedobacter sp.]